VPYDRTAAELLYREYRQEAYQELERTMASVLPGFSAGPIGSRALAAWREQWVPLPRPQGLVGGWDWEDRRKEFRTPSRFEVALWSGDSLCGLAIGKPSGGKHIVGVNFMERAWRDDNPLRGRVMEVVAACAAEYAWILGSKAVRFWHPAEGLIQRYQRLGFHYSVEAGHPFCELIL
jgi:hypothetical protein